MRKIKLSKIIFYSFALITLVSIGVGIGYAAFGDKGQVLGSTFSVGSADLKILKEPSLGTDSSNLADSTNGPAFTNIIPNWFQTYGIKFFNNGSSTVGLMSNAKYLTANDEADLRNIIFIEIFPWNDVNINGIIDSGELGATFGKKTIVKWNTEGIDLGTINKGDVVGFALKFSTDAVSETKQGKTATFDFEFSALGL